MKNIIAIASFAALLAACGGSDAVNTEITLDGQHITVTANAWRANGSAVPPGADGPGCPGLVVVGNFTANPGAFPRSITVGRVQLLLGDKVIWQGVVDPAANIVWPDNVLSTNAHDCFPAGLEVDQHVTVVYEVTGSQGTARIAAPEVTIGLAS